MLPIKFISVSDVTSSLPQYLLKKIEYKSKKSVIKPNLSYIMSMFQFGDFEDDPIFG